MTDKDSLIHDKSYASNHLAPQNNFLAGKIESSFDAIDLESREEFNSLISPRNIADELQKAVDKIIVTCPDVDWDENFLSYQVITAIRGILSQYKIPGTDNDLKLSKFDVEAYKLTGGAERTHGDLAVIVTHAFKKTGRIVSGVGFYEAKASALPNYYAKKYPAYSFQQLRKLVTNTPKLSYLLYDREASLAETQEWPTIAENLERWTLQDSQKPCHVRTVDANFVKQFKELDRAADSFGQSFGYHFVQKILSGRELDYSRPPVETIRRWLKSPRRTSALVISIVVQEGVNEPISAQIQLPYFETLSLPTYHHNSLSGFPNEQRRLQEPKE